ncbi:MAG TPA: hypothetical protein VID72_04690, partial [Ktedonobacterales bacterium]
IGGFDQQTRNLFAGNAEAYVVQLQRAGLIRGDLPVSIVLYMMAALKVGIITAPELVGQERMPAIEQLTEAISDLMRRWLEPEQLPSESETGKHLLAELLANVQDIEEHRESKRKRG